MNHFNDTIFSLATPIGSGAISIVRLSGLHAYEIAKKIIPSTSELKPRYAHLYTLLDFYENPLDKAIVIFFKAPHSYTGEDCIEFQLHGGEAIVHRLIKTLLHWGATQAQAGEFTKRAFLNNKIDLTQAEAIAAMIKTKSEKASKLLARHMHGELENFIETLRQKLIEVIAFTEVSIDYAEEEFPADLLLQVNERLNYVHSLLDESLHISKRREGLLEGYRIAIIGKPNVGKSSLLNNLLAYERAIVSDIAGTTRDTIEENITLAGHKIKFIDTAGLRTAHEHVEKVGIERSTQAARSANMIIALFDGSRVFDHEDDEVLHFLHELRQDKEILAIINKNDLPLQFEQDKLKDFYILSLSHHDSAQVLCDKITEYLLNDSSDDDVMFISERQIDIVEQALNILKNAKTLLHEGSLELFAYHIRDALDELSLLTHPVGHHEILDAMFSNFCLGK